MSLSASIGFLICFRIFDYFIYFFISCSCCFNSSLLFCAMYFSWIRSTDFYFIIKIFTINTINIYYLIIYSQFNSIICFQIISHSMENSTKFQLAHFYSSLQAIEKKAQRDIDFRKTDKPKTFFKSKNQFTVKPTSHGLERKSKKLILSNRDSQQTKNINNSDGIPQVNLQDIEESFINKKITLNNSSVTKSENQKIILEIRGLSPENDETMIRAARKDELNIKKCIKKERYSQNTQSQQIDQSFEQKQRDDMLRIQMKNTNLLIQTLKQRNKVFQIVKKNCEAKDQDYGKQFQRKWEKYQLYKRLIQKMSILLIKNS